MNTHIATTAADAMSVRKRGAWHARNERSAVRRGMWGEGSERRSSFERRTRLLGWPGTQRRVPQVDHGDRPLQIPGICPVEGAASDEEMQTLPRAVHRYLGLLRPARVDRGSPMNAQRVADSSNALRHKVIFVEQS